MKYLKYSALFIFLILGVFSGTVFFKGCSYLGKVTAVVEQQVDPAKLLKDYVRFKDLSAQCDRAKADIEVHKSRMTNMERDYEGTARKDWDRTDKEQFNQWNTEVTNMISNYNGMAAQYNADMSKINYSFTNIGSLPKGASEPLPREVRAYQTK